MRARPPRNRSGPGHAAERARTLRDHGARFLKFGAVGLLGVGVNMGVFAILHGAAEVADYIARVLAIEIAVLHNFTWNFFWTWSDRGRSLRNLPRRLLKYHGSTFLSSFVITLATGALADWLLGDTPYADYLSHLIGIGAGMITNYLLSDLWVFRRRSG
ncbi:MAG: hypothetical protein MAG453_01695 [Calditrichaeota bacterium]|nr:hypothetical protein [Calditrichota bacterium]